MLVSLDMHIHTCLSPCAHPDMTPDNIAQMAGLKGLGLIAAADHNSAGNTADLLRAAKGLVGVVPAMELETAEGVHVLAYFPRLDGCLAVSRAVYETLPPFPVNMQLYGPQIYMENDRERAREPKLLSQTAAFSIDALFALVRAHGGVPVPAHIDRSSHGLLAVLGFIPPELNCTALELQNRQLAAQYPGYRLLFGSDAHQLEDIAEKGYCETDLPAPTPEAFVAWLQGKGETAARA